MKVKFWGCRGSIPKCGKGYEKYGGDTICIEVQTNSGEIFILDAGSGICAFEHDFSTRQNTTKPTILLTHYHADHVCGIPFFKHIYNPEKLSIYGPLLHGKSSLEELLAPLFDGIYFPVLWDSLPKHDLIGFEIGKSWQIGSAKIETLATKHPGGCVAYKITADNESVVFTGDHEMGDENIDKALGEFAKNADIFIVDSSFTKKEYANHMGWGHSDFYSWLDFTSGVKNLVFFHHSPEHDDAFLDFAYQRALEEKEHLKNKAPQNAIMATQGLKINAGKIELESAPDDSDSIMCEFLLNTTRLSDTHSVLDVILRKARELSKADAGTIYLRDRDKLAFSCAQNDTLFKGSKANKFFYLNSQIAIDKSSIAGYCATSRQSLNIKDVYNITDLPLSFNDSFDKSTGYKTTSMLVIPLIDGSDKLVGVLQLINCLFEGEVVAFSHNIEKLISKLGKMAALPLERALMTEDMVMRMLNTSALRDPKETAGHVWRVGCMAAELYQHWAGKHNVDIDEMLSIKGQLRLAAMLHDVGKVGIPDAILKKPGRLDDDERAFMQRHAAMGAKLFEGSDRAIDKMAYEIALHHHAKWDGSGYTGSDEIISPKGEQIPLFARITSIVDVYDALVSKRVYKDAWDSSDALEVLRKDAGTHFDPELVELFAEIQPVIQAIFEKYQG